MEKEHNHNITIKEMIKEEVIHIDKLREVETKRIDDKFKDIDIKYQIQFTAAEKAIAIASTAQEKLVAQALDGTKEAINKADIATDKRFELLGEKINNLSDTLSKNTGAQGIYVTHTDLSVFGDKMQISFENALKPLVSQVNILTVAQGNQQGKTDGAKNLWGLIVGGIFLLIGVASFITSIIK